MIILIYLFMLLGAGLIIMGITGHKRDIVARLIMPKKKISEKEKLHSFLIKIFPFSGKILRKIKFEERFKQKLDASHLRITPAELLNIKLLLMIFLAVLTFFIFGKWKLIAVLVALALGYFLPDLYLHRKIAQRRYVIARLLPETVDLLGLCIEAGLDFTTAVRWVIEKIPSNPLLEEFRFILEEIKWGKQRSQALRDMSKRLNIPEVTSFVHTLVQAERMGTPVAEAFTILSEDTRAQRFHRGERFAMQAPIKILIPLIFCILPVIGIIIGGPIFLQFTQSTLLKGLGK